MVVIASVPHSGSHFAVETVGLPLRSRAPGGVAYANLWHVYSGESLKYIKENAEGGMVVVPLRHPLAVAQSWANRGKPIAEHPVHEPMIRLWRNLIEHVVPLKPYYLPVDIEKRETYLKRLGKALGREIKTTWHRVSHHPVERAAQLFDDDIEAVLDLIKHPFFKEFGYSNGDAR
jgi:hypothetical protein